MADEERAWFREHPEPQVTPTPEGVSLWNYPVASAVLAPAHGAALQSFLGLRLLLGPASGAEGFSVLGHASASGELAGNVQLAKGRAENVRTYLIGLGLRPGAITADGAGSSQPAEQASSGPAYARNRRVDVTMYEPAPILEPPRPVAWDGSAPLPETDGAGADLSAFTQGRITQKLGTYVTQSLIIDVSLEANFKAKATAGKGAVAGLVLEKGKGPGGRLETKIVDDLTAKLGFAPDKGTFSLGLEDKVLTIPLEIGLQGKAQFVYFSVSVPKLRLANFDLEDANISVELTLLKLRFDVGPTPALAERMGRFAITTAQAAAIAAASPAGVTAATLGGAAIVAVGVIGGTIYLTIDAKREGLEYAHRLAARDGAASKVALETLGTATLASYDDRKMEWLKIAGPDGEDAFRAGVRVVQEHLNGLVTNAGDGRAARRAAWVTEYARGANVLDFNLVRERVFAHLGQYDRAEIDVKAAVAAL